MLGKIIVLVMLGLVVLGSSTFPTSQALAGSPQLDLGTSGVLGSLNVTQPETHSYNLFLPVVRRSGLFSKRGVGATTGGCPVQTDGASLRLLEVSWAFGWGPGLAKYPGVEMVPMIRDARHVGESLGGSSQYLLGFNEPEEQEPFGCNMSPAEAAVLWREVEKHYPERRLVSPATVNDRQWLRRMVYEYQARYGEVPRFDAISMYCYNPSDWIGECQRSVAMLYEWGKEWGVPEGIWVNEFANPWLSGQQQIAAMMEMVRWLESDERVDRYAWFAARYHGQAWAPGWNTQLLECDINQLTPLGLVYTSVR